MAVFVTNPGDEWGPLDRYSSTCKVSSQEHTKGHIDCPACLGARAVQRRLISPEMSFLEAFDLWMQRRSLTSSLHLTDARYLAKNSERDYRACGVALGRFFNSLTLKSIHVGHMMEYQRARASCDVSACSGGTGVWSKPCGANRIRKEIDMLIRILRAAQLWGEDEKEEFVKLRPVDLDVGRALDPAQQDHFLRVAASREEWQFVLWYANVGLQTAAATNELRSLQLGDINLGHAGFETIHIRPEGAKNRYRIRTIPLVGPAVWAMKHLVDRARQLGSSQPHHYLFPIQTARGFYDCSRPMSNSGLKKRWEQVRDAAGLRWLRPYDLRHTGITRMAESGVPIDVAMSLVGHMTMAMHRHYTSISKGAKRNWLQATWDAPAPVPMPPGRKPAKSVGGDMHQSGNNFLKKTAFIS